MSDYASRRVTMVDTQVRPSDVTKFPIIEAMLAVPREVYVPADKREAAYVGENIPLGGDRVMLEARTLAKMLDALDVQPGRPALPPAGQGVGLEAQRVEQVPENLIGNRLARLRALLLLYWFT